MSGFWGSVGEEQTENYRAMVRLIAKLSDQEFAEYQWACRDLTDPRRWGVIAAVRYLLYQQTRYE